MRPELEELEGVPVLEELEDVLPLEEDEYSVLSAPLEEEEDDCSGTLTLSKEIAVSAFDAPPASQPASANAKSAETNNACLWFLFIENPPYE